nr:hypothetical protein 58 [Balneolaceae bacterium]
MLQSKKNPEAFFYVAPVGDLRGQTWYTLVLARRDRHKTAFVSTAFNAERYTNKGEAVWGQGSGDGKN